MKTYIKPEIEIAMIVESEEILTGSKWQNQYDEYGNLITDGYSQPGDGNDAAAKHHEWACWDDYYDLDEENAD